MRALIVLTLLPLVVIAGQIAFGATGIVGYSLYKIAMLIPPLAYCRMAGLSVRRDVLKLQNWRRGLKRAIGLGVAAIVVFWGLYWALGDRFLDKPALVEKIYQQFGVNAETVFYVAPFTILVNSLLEEFFYRGFSFGQLVRRNRRIGYVLPAVAFTIQHLAFTYHWTGPAMLVLGIVALTTFAMVLQWVYEATETLVAPWLIHVFGDIAMMGVAVELIL